MMRKHDYLRMIAQISVPEGLQERVLAQADRESVKVNEIPKFRKSTGRKLLRPAICMGLILVLVLGSVMPRNEEAVPPSGERSVGGGAFVLTAYAEEPLPAANGNLVLGGKGRTVISHTVLIPEQAQYTNYMFSSGATILKR